MNENGKKCCHSLYLVVQYKLFAVSMKSSDSETVWLYIAFHNPLAVMGRGRCAHVTGLDLAVRGEKQKYSSSRNRHFRQFSFNNNC